MSKTDRAESVADRLERTYLGLLRALTLVVATICIIGAAIFALDGARRLLTPTEVKPEAVAVTPEEALGPIVETGAARKDAAQDQVTAIPAEIRNAHAAFIEGTFEPYYQQYRRLALAYNKPEDQILAKPDLAKHLGYTVEALAGEYDTQKADAGASPEDAAAGAMISGLVRTSKQFQTNSAYAEAQAAAVAKALADPRLVGKARGYKSAEKTAQACHTEYEMRTVWDSTSMACRDWYYQPYGCSVRRPMPLQKCEPAYPEGIKSPLQLFAQVDEGYRLAWSSKTSAAEAAAAAESAEKELFKAGAPASLMLALQVGGAFLVVMFLFLLIAVERHLRRVAQRREPAPREPIAQSEISTSPLRPS